MPMLTVESKKFRDKRLRKFKKFKKDDKDSRQKLVIILGRQVPADVNSSLMLESLVRFLISEDEKAAMLRSRFIFKVLIIASSLIDNSYGLRRWGDSR